MRDLQIAAARALLQLERRELARLANVNVSTLSRLEGAGWNVAGNFTTITRITDVLKSKGIEFIPGGVRLISQPRKSR